MFRMITKTENQQIQVRNNIWASYSRLRNFPAMFVLVLPNSDFHQFTKTCQKNHEAVSYHYYYEFNELELTALSKNKNEVKVTGLVKLNIPKIDIVYKGIFVSTCCRSN